MLTEDQILTLADEHSKSGAQNAAAAAALRAAMQLIADTPMRQGSAPDVTHGEAIPAAPVVICVGSVQEVSREQERELWTRLDKALSLYGRIEIVTFGGRGNEVNAHKWAKARNMPVREYAPAWSVVKTDGSTRRDSNARSVRDRKLKAFLAKAEQVFTLEYVSDDDRTSRRITAMHQQILRWHPLKTRAVAPAPQAAPMDLTHPGSTDTVVDHGEDDAEEQARLEAEAAIS